MHRLWVIAFLMIATPLLAQEGGGGLLQRLFGSDTDAETDQGGFLERTIEENLSGEGRNVEIEGFAGILGGRATLESLAISDPEGVWLRMSDVVLDWNRAALLRGRIEVAELSAGTIELPRLPTPAEDAPPAPEASGFSLPELPVSISIETLSAELVEIGEPVFGAATTATVEASLGLSGGEGDAKLSIERLNDFGNLGLDASYSNETRVLALDISVAEGPDGLLANLLDLPGRPSVEFSATGEAPVDSFAADILLATDNAERLTGRIATLRPEDAPGSNIRFEANVSGDIAPLFAPDIRPFFGDDVSLQTQLTTFEDGRIVLDELALSAETLDLQGFAAIGADRLPREIDLRGSISSGDGGPVRLPLSGPPTTVRQVDLEVQFDAAISEDWTGRFEISNLDRPGFSARSLALDVDGLIAAGTAPAVDASIRVEAEALDLGDPDAQGALGERVTGAAEVSWRGGDPVQLEDLRVSGETYSLTGTAELIGGENGLAIAGEARVEARELARFSGLAQRPLSGAAEVDADFAIEPLAGFFDVTVGGETTSLTVGQPELDRVLSGTARLELAAARDLSGMTVDLQTLKSPHARITGQASLKTGKSSLALEAKLDDVSLVVPELAGGAALGFQAASDDGLWNWTLESVLAGSEVAAEGVAENVFEIPEVSGVGRLTTPDLGAFSELAGRTLSGGADLAFSGDVIGDLSRASLSLEGMANNLRIGQPEADALMEGAVSISVDAGLSDNVYSVSRSSIEGPQISVRGEGSYGPSEGGASVTGRISDLSRLLEGAPSAPLPFSFQTNRKGRDWSFDLTASTTGVSLSSNGVALDVLGDSPAVDGELKATVDDASVLSEFAGRPLKGRISVDAAGSVAFDLSDFDIRAAVDAEDARIGEPNADRLLAGPVSLRADARKSGEAIRISEFTFESDFLRASADGALGDKGEAIELKADLRDIAPFAPGFSGPVSATGTLRPTADGAIELDLEAQGPGGSRVAVAGTAERDVSSVGLGARGTLPLGLMDRFVAPRSLSGSAGFDLRIDGAPAVGNVTGLVAISSARFVAPDVGVNLNSISGNIELAGGAASLAATGALETGGQVSLEGGAGLSAPFTGDIVVKLSNAVLTDPRLYETVLNGEIRIAGPLAGGARISGGIDVGTTTVRIPSSGLGGAGAVPDIIHIDEPPPVRGTRRRAGLLDGEANGGGGGPEYGLDISVTAPNRVFVRGRGLDAEFGGAVKLAGTTRAVVPSGAFNLIRGRLDILGQRLVIDEATITLEGSLTPVVRIRATADADEYRISVLVTGPVTEPDIEFTSQPELPEEEVISRLLFGRGLDTLSPIQAARLALAVRTLAGRGGEGVVGNIRQGAGLADLDVTTDEEGNTQFRAGAYLSDNLYTDVTVGGGGETILNLNLDVSRSVTVKGSVSNDGDTSIGVFFERDY
ncbi:MAG: translocation/assembly module TamB domain-containing protein [Paracoccaceae bacterium]|nr:translocation/assembly module TamB domain-containing protein [Paracoccaceae bacterium]